MTREAGTASSVHADRDGTDTGQQARPTPALASLGVFNPQAWLRRSAVTAERDRRGNHGVVDQVLDKGIYVALLALFFYFWVASPYFLSGRNLLNVGVAVAVDGVLAAGMTVALIAGQLDLTVGSNIALTSVVSATLIQTLHWGTIPAVLAGLAVGVAIGAANSLLIVVVGINSIIATLAMGIVLQAVALIITNGQDVPLTNLALPNFINAQPLGVPTSVWILLGIFLVIWVVMTFTRAGWHVYGVGGSPSAALRAGIRVKRLYTGVFLTSGVLGAVGGLITLGNAATGGPDYGIGIEFSVLTAVLLGGIGLSGGSGKVLRTLAGVLVIGILDNGLTLMSVSSYYQQLASGAVFVIAVVMGAIALRRRAR